MDCLCTLGPSTRADAVQHPRLSLSSVTAVELSNTTLNWGRAITRISSKSRRAAGASPFASKRDEKANQAWERNIQSLEAGARIYGNSHYLPVKQPLLTIRGPFLTVNLLTTLTRYGSFKPNPEAKYQIKISKFPHSPPKIPFLRPQKCPNSV
jgi:hypothetical protein